MVTILRLTHSSDFDEAIPEAQRATSVAQRTFSEISGVEATTVAKTAWPARELPAILDRWVDRYQPDIVFLIVNPYWFTYESVPIKLQRKLKFGGERLANVGLGAAPRFENYRAFRLLQRAAQKTIGGETHFTPQEVVERVQECARRVLARESPVLVVSGPSRRIGTYESGARRRATPKLAWMDRELGRFCRELGLVYHLQEADLDAADYVSNRFHSTAHRHAVRGEAEGHAMASAWQLAHDVREPARG